MKCLDSMTDAEKQAERLRIERRLAELEDGEPEEARDDSGPWGESRSFERDVVIEAELSVARPGHEIAAPGYWNKR